MLVGLELQSRLAEKVCEFNFQLAMMRIWFCPLSAFIHCNPRRGPFAVRSDAAGSLLTIKQFSTSVSEILLI